MTVELKPSRYQAYLLRFWEESGSETEATTWRLSLEDPRTGKRRGFASLEALISHIKLEMAKGKQ